MYFWLLVIGRGPILRYISISILIKYSNFSRFYKKLGPFYKKLRCDKFGNWSISTKNALNNQIQSSMKIYMYIVWNCCLPIADFETTGVHVNHVDSVVMPSQNKPIAWILGRKSQQEKRTLLTFQIGIMWESQYLFQTIEYFYMERITFVKTSLLPSKNDEFHENAHFL